MKLSKVLDLYLKEFNEYNGTDTKADWVKVAGRFYDFNNKEKYTGNKFNDILFQRESDGDWKITNNTYKKYPHNLKMYDFESVPLAWEDLNPKSIIDDLLTKIKEYVGCRLEKLEDASKKEAIDKEVNKLLEG